MLLAKIESWSDVSYSRRLQVFSLLFLGALAFFGLGIWEHTGVTGKDEYYLGLRTPMCMVEQEAWLVPCLDGEPRFQKPPFLYWLTAVSYETFGVSLISAQTEKC
jgi:4-amino-4-deoxy-L-arabinose transferase-like glycosyltransferase